MASKPAAPNPGKAPEAEATAEQPKGRGKKILLAVLALLLLGGLGAGGWFFWQQRQAEAHKGAAAAPAEPPAPLIYYAFAPPFVANFEAGGGARFLQVDVRVASRSPETIELVKANEPLLRNDLLMLYGQQDSAALANRAGKDRLRAESLATVRRIVKTLGGKPESVESVLFASFVMQ